MVRTNVGAVPPTLGSLGHPVANASTCAEAAPVRSARQWRGGGESDIQPDHDLCSEGEDTSALLLLLRTIPRSSSVRSPIALQKASTV
jgi:hypothetical protein